MFESEITNNFEQAFTELNDYLKRFEKEQQRSKKMLFNEETTKLYSLDFKLENIPHKNYPFTTIKVPHPVYYDNFPCAVVVPNTIALSSLRDQALTIPTFSMEEMLLMKGNNVEAKRIVEKYPVLFVEESLTKTLIRIMESFSEMVMIVPMKNIHKLTEKEIFCHVGVRPEDLEFFRVDICNNEMTLEEATENLEVVLSKISSICPGGETNYEMIHLEVSRSSVKTDNMPTLLLGSFVLEAGVRVLPEQPIDDILNGVINDLVVQLQRDGNLTDEEARLLRRPSQSIYM